jgi:ubiquinone biosynthesis protein
MRRRLRLLLRLLSIERTLVAHGLDEFVSHTHLFRPLAWIYKLRRRPKRTVPRGVRVRQAIEALGPIFVKFGQAVSVRRDLLPPDVAAELAKLQDQVPPFDADIAVATIEQVFGRSIDQVYRDFEREPIAAASIAQVHAATLPDGEHVIVKLLRPQVREHIRRDLEVLYAIAELAETYWGEAQRLHPVEIVEEFDKTLINELDLMREAANAAQLKRNFANSEKLYVPEVYWDYCRSNILTMERISGVPISDLETLRRERTNIKRLAENGVEIFFTQVFRHNFFHADMHPGNIFVDVSDPDNPRYVAVDFGIVGTLSSTDQLYLAENFLAFFRRDYRRVAVLHVDSGWVPRDTRVDELESAIRAVCEPIFDKPLKDISFGFVLLRLFETARSFQMEVQPQLVLLQKTLLAIEGLGRQLYPELDLWQTAHPVLEEWMKQRRDPLYQLKKAISDWPQISEDLQILPGVLHRTIRELDASSRHGRVRRTQRVGDRKPVASMGRYASASTLLVAAVIWHGLAAEPSWLGWLGMVCGVVALPWRRS